MSVEQALKSLWMARDHMTELVGELQARGEYVAATQIGMAADRVGGELLNLDGALQEYADEVSEVEAEARPGVDDYPLDELPGLT